MLLSDADLRKELEAGRLVLDPWDPAMLQPSSVDVRLDRFFRVFQNSRYTHICLLYTSPSPRDGLLSRMPSSA